LIAIRDLAGCALNSAFCIGIPTPPSSASAKAPINPDGPLRPQREVPGNSDDPFRLQPEAPVNPDDPFPVQPEAPVGPDDPFPVAEKWVVGAVWYLNWTISPPFRSQICHLRKNRQIFSTSRDLAVQGADGGTFFHHTARFEPMCCPDGFPSLRRGNLADVDVNLAICAAAHVGDLKWPRFVAREGAALGRRLRADGELDDDTGAPLPAHESGGCALRTQHGAVFAGGGDDELSAQIDAFAADSAVGELRRIARIDNAAARDLAGRVNA